jgi:hypothetical protein
MHLLGNQSPTHAKPRAVLFVQLTLALATIQAFRKAILDASLAAIISINVVNTFGEYDIGQCAS